MLKITENNILKDFSCIYEDEYRNWIRVARNEHNGFYVRVKPANKNTKVDVIRISLPVEDDGVNVNCHFLDGKDYSDEPSVSAALMGAAELINRWAMMITTVLTIDICASYKNDKQSLLMINMLSQYEELKPIVESVVKK